MLGGTSHVITIKVSGFLFNAALANFLFLISFTRLVNGKTSSTILNLHKASLALEIQCLNYQRKGKALIGPPPF